MYSATLIGRTVYLLSVVLNRNYETQRHTRLTLCSRYSRFLILEELLQSLVRELHGEEEILHLTLLVEQAFVVALQVHILLCFRQVPPSCFGSVVVNV